MDTIGRSNVESTSSIAVHSSTQGACKADLVGSVPPAAPAEGSQITMTYVSCIYCFLLLLIDLAAQSVLGVYLLSSAGQEPSLHRSAVSNLPVPSNTHRT